jgi:3-phosphoshikimate 1-carboxyvinyltransferase
VNVRINPGPVSGSISAPPSKSMMQRVLAIAFLRNASIVVRNPGYSADDRAVMGILEDAGFLLTEDTDALSIQAPEGRKELSSVSFGESGLAARMMGPVLALQGSEVQLTGAAGLRARPMHFLEEVLPQLGASVTTTNGSLPATIRGPIRPADIRIIASLSSQVLTGLLLAYAGAGAKDVTITVDKLSSKPYIDLTLAVMELMGLPLPKNNNYESFYFSGAPARPTPAEVSIEGDWSGAAFALVAGAIAGRATVTKLDAFSTQGDKAILTALMECGVQLSIEAAQVTVAATRLNAFQFDATDTPDLFPPLAALACYATGTSVIEGVGRLRHKESDRAATIVSELGRMGADISIQDDLMIVRGGKRLQGFAVSSHNDHRIAMMCAVVALGAEGTTSISGAEAVAKSYPSFFEDMRSLGAGIEVAE